MTSGMVSMSFSTRETQVLELLRHGFTNKEIAQGLGISPHTVRDHISRMLVRYCLTGRAALAALHVQRRLEEPVSATPWDRRGSGQRRVQQTLQL